MTPEVPASAVRLVSAAAGLTFILDRHAYRLLGAAACEEVFPGRASLADEPAAAEEAGRLADFLEGDSPARRRLAAESPDLFGGPAVTGLAFFLRRSGGARSRMPGASSCCPASLTPCGWRTASRCFLGGSGRRAAHFLLDRRPWRGTIPGSGRGGVPTRERQQSSEAGAGRPLRQRAEAGPARGAQPPGSPERKATPQPIPAELGCGRRKPSPAAASRYPGRKLLRRRAFGPGRPERSGRR
jgi:hypothetical protein